jgi:hypothetical protein
MARTPRPPKKLGILSSINLTQSSHDLFDDIEDGYGAPRQFHHINVLRSELAGKRNDLITNQGCEIIATVGGLFVNAGIDDGAVTNVEFVSLVGEIPILPAGSKCVGGVSLETVNTNAARRAHLLAKPGITSRSMIGLYRPFPGTSQTQVSSDEEAEWNDDPRIFDSTLNFDQDLNGGALIPAGIKALVISASPVFLLLDNMSALVKAANKWLSNDRTRFIVYPLQIYQEANQKPQATPASSGAKRITLLGPDLHNACKLLGSAARFWQFGGSPGFTTAQILTSEL